LNSAPGHSMTSHNSGLRILLVEDEAIIAMLLEDMLGDLGHRVVAIAGRMEQAEKLAAEIPLDLAIVDVNLNGQQTYPLAAILTDRGVPFIFATGYGASGLKEEWRKIPTLQKPFQETKLAEAISQVTRALSE